MTKFKRIIALLTTVIMIFFASCSADAITGNDADKVTKNTAESAAVQTSSGQIKTTSKNSDAKFEYSSIDEYDGKPYTQVNSNIPYFTESDYSENSFETYSELDELGRCGVCFACVGSDIMPDEERGSIGSVKPSGWQTVKYGNVDGKYLYNRCHLIGYQLTGENANEKNLITGTRYLNTEGMLPFENDVAEYVKDSSNHVLYRVTPVFEDNELVARGVLMEAYSVEDNGSGICFNVFCYNVQPGITIDYKTGKSKADNSDSEIDDESDVGTFIINTSSKKFHTPDCSSVKDIDSSNKKKYTGKRDNLINNGYKPCKRCNP